MVFVMIEAVEAVVDESSVALGEAQASVVIWGRAVERGIGERLQNGWTNSYLGESALGEDTADELAKLRWNNEVRGHLAMQPLRLHHRLG